MKVKIERQLFGSLLEDDIKTAIDSTSLKDFTIHNLVLKIGTLWRQYDHIIVTPHRIVPIEAKSTSTPCYRVTEGLDYFGLEGQEKSYDTSVVQQVVRARANLAEIINPHLIDYKSVITPIGCIRAPKIVNEQSILPIHSDKTLWYFIKSLEAELNLYPKSHQEDVFDSFNRLISTYRISNDKYLLHLKRQGVDIHKIMTIEEEYLVPTKMVISEDENQVLSNYNKTSERLSKLGHLLGKTMDTIPLDAYNYALKYSTVPIELIYEYIVNVEDLSKECPFLKLLLNKNSHFIRYNYILNHCKDNNIFFSEFLLAVVNKYKELYPESYFTLLAGHLETEIHDLNFEVILMNLKRGNI